MRTFALSLIFSLLAPQTFAQLATGPIVLPPEIPDLKIEIPTFDLGDWNSSGDAQMSPVPPTVRDVGYQCQAQITDGITRRGPRGAFKRYQIADFRLTRERLFLAASELRWFGVNFYSVEKIENTRHPAPFRVDGAWVSMSFRESDPNAVILALNIRQHLGAIIVDHEDRFEFSLKDRSIEAQVWNRISHAEDAAIPRMSLRVVCHRFK